MNQWIAKSIVRLGKCPDIMKIINYENDLVSSNIYSTHIRI
jgi:hypothetical protein